MHVILFSLDFIKHLFIVDIVFKKVWKTIILSRTSVTCFWSFFSTNIKVNHMTEGFLVLSKLLEKYFNFLSMRSSIQHVYKIFRKTKHFSPPDMGTYVCISGGKELHRKCCICIICALPPWFHHNSTLCAQVHELPQSHCGDNREGTLFSWLNIYITPILLLWDLSTLFVMNHLWSLHIFFCISGFAYVLICQRYYPERSLLM